MVIKLSPIGCPPQARPTAQALCPTGTVGRVLQIRRYSPGSFERMKTNRPYRVMVVDDNRDAADSMAMMLEARGYTVCPVYDGRDALRLFHEFEPEVAILDIGLPHVSGYELAAQFRQDAARCVLLAIS